MKTILISLVLALGLAAQQPPVRSLICEPTSNSGTTYTCGGSPALAAYTTGLRIQFKADVANTGAMTINVDGLGAKALTKLSGAIDTALAANDVRANQYVLAIYDGTQFQMLSQLGNAATSGSGVGMVISATQASVAASTNGIYGPYGSTTGVTASQSTNYVRVASPWPVACTASKLRVNMGSAQASGAAMTAALYVNGADTALTCSVAAAGTACNDATHTVSIAEGDLVAWHLTNASGSGASQYVNVTAICQ